MKNEEVVSAAHLIQAAKLGNAKAESILRTGKKVAKKVVTPPPPWASHSSTWLPSWRSIS